MAISTYLVWGGVAIATLALAPLVTLPSTRTVTRAKLVDAQPDAIYQTLASTEGFQRFNPYRDTDPKLSIEPFGPPSGVGAGFRFEGKEGKGTQTIAQLDENRQVVMTIDLGAMGKPQQTFRLKPQGEKTMVEWSVKSDFGFNPVFRVFGLFMDGMFGPIYERGLNNLDRSVSASS